MAVADEKRKWQVLFFSRDGKPDKRRRPGRPWDSSVFAGPEKAVYSVGSQGVDLLAHEVREGDELLKMGSQASAQRTLDKISLQAYLEEVNHYEQLLQPITDIMQQSLKAPTDIGWGPEGQKLAPALQDIGALPQTKRKSKVVTNTEIIGLDSARSTSSSLSDLSSHFKTQPLVPIMQGKRRKASKESSNRYRSVLSDTESILSKKMPLLQIDEVTDVIVPVNEVVTLEQLSKEMNSKQELKKIKQEERREIKKSRRNPEVKKFRNAIIQFRLKLYQVNTKRVDIQYLV